MGRIIKKHPCPSCGEYALSWDQYWGYCCHNCGGTWTSDEMEAIEVNYGNEQFEREDFEKARGDG